MKRATWIPGLLVVGVACATTSAPTPRAATPEATPAPPVAASPPPMAPEPSTPTTPDAGAPAADATNASADLAQRRYAEGVEAATRRDWDAAARAFGDAFAALPSVELAFNAARMFEHLAEFERAAEWYRRALTRDPAPVLRAQITARIDAMERDARRRQEGIAQAPPDSAALSAEASSWFQRGLQFVRRRQWAQALQSFEQAQQFVQGAGAGVPELMFNLGVAHERLGHRDEAEAAYRSYLAARPDSPDRGEIERRIRELRR